MGKGDVGSIPLTQGLLALGYQGIKTLSPLYENVDEAFGSHLSHAMGEAEPCWLNDVLTLGFSGDAGCSGNSYKQRLSPSHLLKKRT